MDIKTKKIILITIALILFIFISPFTYFNDSTNIKIHNKTNNYSISGSKTKIDSYVHGIIFNRKKINLNENPKVKILKYSVLHFGFFSKMDVEILFERIVNNETIETTIEAESKVWGLGKLNTRKNNFESHLKKTIDKIYSEK